MHWKNNKIYISKCLIPVLLLPYKTIHSLQTVLIDFVEISIVEAQLTIVIAFIHHLVFKCMLCKLVGIGI